MGRPPEQGPASLRGGWTGLSGCGCGVAAASGLRVWSSRSPVSAGTAVGAFCRMSL